MAAGLRAGGGEGFEAGPLAGVVAGPGEPSRKPSQPGRDFIARAADDMGAHQCCAGLPKSAGGNRLTDCGDPPLLIKGDRDPHAATARRGAEIRTAIGIIKQAKMRNLAGEPNNLSRVKWPAHARRQVVPVGPSSSRMPSAAS